MLKFIFWPFWLLWSFVGLLFELFGKLLGMIVGFALAVAGVALTATVVGAIVGIPLLLTGGALFIRSLF